MNKTIFGVIAGILLALQATLTLAAGDVLALKDGHPKTYVVKKGDTLWDISGMFLEDPWLWPQIWHVNPQVDNPHLIFPGDVLNLVYIDGQPRLVVKRSDTVKLSPQVKLSSLDAAIPAIPLNVIAPFLSNSRIIQPNDLEGAPYVLAGKGGHIIAGAGDDLFARGEFAAYDTESFGIFRPGDAYIDPESREILGYQAFAIASAKIKALNGDIATLGLNQTNEEVRRGDRLLPDEERQLTTNFVPSPPPQDTEGYIIAVEGGVSQVSHMDVVVLNKGERDGVAVGNVMAIYRAGEVVRDTISNELVRVPDERSGLLMVFRTFDKVSYGLVLKATGPLRVMDKIKNP